MIPIRILTLTFIFYLMAPFFLFSEEMNVVDHQKKIVFNAAESLFKEKKYNLAFRQYRDFLDLYPEDAYTNVIRERIASIYEKKQYYLKAAETYMDLYAANGSNAQGTQYLFKAAKLYHYMGLKEKAIQGFETINRLMPDSPEARQSKIFLDMEALTEF